MNGFRFVPNRRVVAELARSVLVERELKKRTDQALDVARSIAPVETGAYKAGLSSESGVEGPTVKARLNANDFKSAWLEFGTSRMAARAVLRRACDAAGLKLSGSGRG